jgi:hypothetical protein
MSGETPCRSGVRWYCGQSARRRTGGERSAVDAVLPALLGPCVDGCVVAESPLGAGLLSPGDVHDATRSAETAGSSNRRTAYL